VNDIFDALNRKYPAEGIRPNNNNLKVLISVARNCGMIIL